MVGCASARGVFLAVVVAMALLSGCGGATGTVADVSPTPAATEAPDDTPAPAPAPTATTPAAAAACGEVQLPPRQEGSHLIGDAEPPVPYSSTPGTSGWHAGGAPRTGVFGTEDALTETQLVLALEVGQVVAAYDPTRVSDADVALLAEIAARPDVAGKLTVTPFTERPMATALTLNAWGTQQGCDRVDEAAILGFVETYAEGGPGHQG